MADESNETNEPGPGPGKDPASAPMIGLLALYLVVITGLLLWGIYQRWPSCDGVCMSQPSASASPSPNQAATPTPSPTPSPTPNQTTAPTTPPSTPAQPTPSPTPIKITSVSPTTSLMNCEIVVVKGEGFKQKASVIFGGVPVTGEVDPLGQSISVKPPAHVEGAVDLIVKNPDGATSDIAKAAFNYNCPPVSETRLFLLVVLAGALGGTLHSLRSIYWYTGLRNVVKSWILMYVLLPFIGSAMAVVFYAIIRAGLLPVQTNKSISLVVIAIAILVGLFSPQAAVKLKDIANAFFAKPEPGPPKESKPQGSVPPGDGSAAKPNPATPAITPGKGAAGTQVKITGTGMKTVSSVTFGGVEGNDRSAVAPDGTFTVKAPPQTPLPTTPVDVVVTGDKDPVTLRFTYEPPAS